MKPKIGITLAREEKPSDQEYLEAIAKAGGEPVVLRSNLSVMNASSLDGLVLSGGEDVDPQFYNEKKESFCDEPDRERDEFEFKLLEKFISEEKPVLAICRGIQVLNIYEGTKDKKNGNLYQDLVQQYGEKLHTAHHDQDHLSREEKRQLRHRVRIKDGTMLHKLFGSEIEVNSRHHQAIKALAPSLEISAISEDGVIEGVECKNHRWVMGVQWHPESKEIYPTFAPLFQTFISQCVSSNHPVP